MTDNDPLNRSIASAIAWYYPVSPIEVYSAHLVFNSWDKVIVLCEAMVYLGYDSIMETYEAIKRVSGKVTR